MWSTIIISFPHCICLFCAVGICRVFRMFSSRLRCGSCSPHRGAVMNTVPSRTRGALKPRWGKAHSASQHAKHAAIYREILIMINMSFLHSRTKGCTVRGNCRKTDCRLQRILVCLGCECEIDSHRKHWRWMLSLLLLLLLSSHLYLRKLTWVMWHVGIRKSGSLDVQGVTLWLNLQFTCYKSTPTVLFQSLIEEHTFIYIFFYFLYFDLYGVLRL